MWLVFSAQVAALIVLTIRRWPRWFRLALALWAIQTFSVNLGRTEHWRDTWWMWGECAAMVATAMAVGEAIAALTANSREWQQFRVEVASVGIPFCVAGTGAYFIAPPINFPAFREWIWCFLALRMLVAGLLAALDGGTCLRIVRVHFLVLLTACMVSALIGPFAGVGDGTWYSLREAYRWVMLACCAGWLVIGAIGGWPEVQRKDRRRFGVGRTRVAVTDGSREPA